MARIAVVDLAFRWPPAGGAAADLAAVLERLARTHEVRLFVAAMDEALPVPGLRRCWPLSRTKFFDRGRITGPRPRFAIEPVGFNALSLNFLQVASRFRARVDAFAPDYVVIGDSWHFKPFLMRALRHHRTYVRLFAYECLCPRGKGTFYRRSGPCPYLERPRLDYSFWRCLACSVGYLASFPSPVYLHEFLFGLGFSPLPRLLFRRHAPAMAGFLLNNDVAAHLVANPRRVVVGGGVDLRGVRGADTLAPSSDPAEPVSVLAAGCFDESLKGLSVLLEAGRRLWSERPDFRISITTAAPLTAPFAQPLGWLAPADLAAAYQRCAIVVVPSLWQEPLGLVALEAMAHGKPVVASRVGGLRDVVVDGKTGLLVPPGDPAALAHALRSLLADPARARRLGAAGRRRAREQFDWDTVVAQRYEPLFAAGGTGGATAPPRRKTPPSRAGRRAPSGERQP